MKDGTGLVACCGLYCGDCHMGKGEIADRARDLRKSLREAHFARFAPELAKVPFFRNFTDYETCYRVLGDMVSLRCRKPCAEGGGNPRCAIRACCKRKGYEGCWECAEAGTCKKFDFLKAAHGEATTHNLAAIRKKGREGFVKGKREF